MTSHSKTLPGGAGRRALLADVPHPTLLSEAEVTWLTFRRKPSCLRSEVTWPGFLEPAGDSAPESSELYPSRPQPLEARHAAGVPAQYAHSVP